MIYTWETKAAKMAKRMSTAMFVCSGIRSKYTGFPSKRPLSCYLNTIDTTKNPVRCLFLEHTRARFLYSLYV